MMALFRNTDHVTAAKAEVHHEVLPRVRGGVGRMMDSGLRRDDVAFVEALVP